MLKNNTTNNYTSEKLTIIQGKGLFQWERLVKRREASRSGRGRLSEAIKKAPVVDYNFPEDYDVPGDQGVPGACNVLENENYNVLDDYKATENGSRIKLLPYTNFYLEVYGTK